MKQCNTCRKFKYLTDFYRNKNRPDGYYNQCKCCVDLSRKVVIDFDVTIKTPNYKQEIFKMKLSEPIQDYSESKTIGDWNNLTEEEWKKYQ